jgi:hypothetical protein
VHKVFLGVPTKMFGILGRVIYRWKGLENRFPTVYYMPQEVFETTIEKLKKENL